MIEFARDAVGLRRLDGLRSRRSDGCIYIVDVANTPAGPSCGLTNSQRRKVMYRMGPPFRKLISAFSR